MESYSSSSRRLVVHCEKDRFNIYIGRPSKWGNPFIIGRDGTRKEVIDKYHKGAVGDVLNIPMLVWSKFISISAIYIIIYKKIK